MWLFDYLAYLNPWTYSSPIPPFPHNLRSLDTPPTPLYRRIFGLSNSAGVKRKRAAQVHNSYRAKRGRHEIGFERVRRLPTNEELGQDEDDSGEYDTLNELADIHQTLDDVEDEYGSELSPAWTDSRDLVSGTADDAEVDTLMHDTAYAAFLGPRATGTPDSTPTSTPAPRIMATPKSRKTPKTDFFTKERARRIAQATKSTAAWNMYDASLYERVQLRGLEPLLSKDWEPDFAMLPTALFTADDAAAPVAALGRDLDVDEIEAGVMDIRGARMLQEVLDLGGWVRDLSRFGKQTGSQPETRVKRAVERYLKWSTNDSETGRWPPLCVVVEGSRDVDTAVLQETLVRELLGLRVVWEQLGGYQAVPPPVYGVMCSGPAMLVASLKDPEPDAEESVDSHGSPLLTKREGRGSFEQSAQLRTIAVGAWSDAGQDIWNALTVALLAAHVRNILLDLEVPPSE